MNEPHAFQTALESVDLETQAYSGRGMVGRECLATDEPIDNIVQLLLEQALEEFEFTEDAEQFKGRVQVLHDALDEVKSDTFGHGRITYFPLIPHTPNPDEVNTEAADLDEE